MISSRSYLFCSFLTGVHAFVASLHDGAVDARDEPRARHNAEQQPHDAVADPHHHVVEEEEVAEAVERFPAVEEQRLNGEGLIGYIYLFSIGICRVVCTPCHPITVIWLCLFFLKCTIYMLRKVLSAVLCFQVNRTLADCFLWVYTPII